MLKCLFRIIQNDLIRQQTERIFSYFRKKQHTWDDLDHFFSHTSKTYFYATIDIRCSICIQFYEIIKFHASLNYCLASAICQPVAQTRLVFGAKCV